MHLWKKCQNSNLKRSWDTEQKLQKTRVTFDAL